MPVCASCGKQNPDEARFCLACGTPIAAAAAPAVPAEERKLVTVVFTDLVGSTARSEGLDPEDVKAMVAPYHARVRAELERFGGTFEKFSGDAVMALFGAPVAHEDDAERAVRSALAIRDAIRELNEANEWLDLHIRTGVNTGEALVTLDARPSEGEWMAAGDVMNTAARIQSGAPVDGVLVGEETYRATRHTIEYAEAEPVQAKGKAEPVPVWQAVAAMDGAVRRPTSRVRLVGREAELERLWTLWEDVRANQMRRQATVVGPPGIGKSRLVAEFCDRAAESGGAVYRGRCVSYGEGITYWPIEEVLKDAAGIRHDDDAETGSAKLGALVTSLDTENRDELRTIAVALANLIGAATTPEGTYSATEISQAELHWGIRRTLELLAEQRPLVVVLEDLHWAEPTLLELLRLINEGAAAVPILVLASTRPELAETSRALLQEEANRRVLTLEPLPEDASETILAELLGAEGVAGNPAAAALLRTAGGNPLFLEEIVGMLADVGVVGGDGGGVPEALDDVPVPTSLQALIASRLDQLPVAEKRIAQHASVIGTVFWPGAVAHLDGIEGDLDVGLASLERRDFVHLQQASSVTGEREYVFKHVLTRDVAYGQLPKGRRALLHKRFADWVEALPGGADELVEFVAYHLEQACLLARTVAHPTEPPPIDTAIDALVRAGGKAERREGIREADRFYERALELVDEERRDVVLDLSLRRARLLVTQGYLNEAAARLTEVADAAAELRLRELECSALIALANVDWKQGRATDARARLERAAARAEELADRHLQIRVAYEAAHVTGWFDGAAETIIEALRRPLELAEELRARPLRIEGHMRLGALLLNVGELVEAEEQLRRCIELTSEVGSYRDEARATSMLGFVKYYRGELDEAERLTLQALEWLERTSDSHLQIQNLRFLAKYALARADADLAEQRLREALPLALEAGGWLVIEVYRYLAEALVRQGRLDDARELVAFAARSVPEEDAYARAALLVAEAIVATAGGEQAAASTSFAEALRLLEEQRLWVDLAEARIELARSLQSFGDRAGARTELERVRGALVRMGAGALLAEVAQELPVLTEGTD